MMTHEQAVDLLADFAIDLLEPAEAAAVRAHVEACSLCRDELQVYLHAGEALAFAVEPLEMAAGARERISAGVSARIAGVAGETPAPPRLRLVQPSTVTAGPWRSIALASAAAVLVLAVGLSVAINGWIGARDRADRLEGELLARAIQLPLQGEGTQGVIYVSSDFTGGVARFSGLGPAPTGHHYQVWSEGPSGDRAAADFVGQDGELLVLLPALPADMTRMFVTLEPDGAERTAPAGPELMTTPR